MKALRTIEHHRLRITCVLVTLVSSACASVSRFPREVVDKIDRTVSFKDLSTSPDPSTGLWRMDGSTGCLSFILPAKSPRARCAVRQHGGSDRPRDGCGLHLAGIPARRLTVDAECFHIWRTQGDPIGFPLPRAQPVLAPDSADVLRQATECSFARLMTSQSR